MKKLGLILLFVVVAFLPSLSAITVKTYGLSAVNHVG